MTSLLQVNTARMGVAAAVLGCALLLPPAPARAGASNGFQCPRIDAGEIEGTFFKTRVYQGDKGWFFREGSDLQEFYEYGEGDLAYMGRFAAALQKRGIKLVYLPVPPRALEHPELTGPAVS